MGDLMDEHNKDDSGETEYIWDSTDEQDEEDTKKTTYMWDSMDEQDRSDTMDILKQTDKWVIWKSKDKWATSMQSPGVHQLLHIHLRVMQDMKRDTDKEQNLVFLEPLNSRGHTQEEMTHVTPTRGPSSGGQTSVTSTG